MNDPEAGLRKRLAACERQNIELQQEISELRQEITYLEDQLENTEDVLDYLVSELTRAATLFWKYANWYQEKLRTAKARQNKRRGLPPREWAWTKSGWEHMGYAAQVLERLINS